MTVSQAGLDFVNKFILEVALPEGSDGEPTGAVSIAKLGKARIEWIGLRRSAMQEIDRLKSVIEQVYAQDDDAKSAVNGALSTLGSAIDKLNSDLEEQLDDVLNAESDARGPLVKTAVATTKTFLNLCDADPIISNIDGNEFTPDMSIVGPMRGKLLEVNASLGA